MNDQALNKKLFELEAAADLMIDRAQAVKKYINSTRKKLGGVSTSPVRKGKGLSEKEIANVLSRRKETLLKRKPNN